MSLLLNINHCVFRDMTELFMDAKSSATMLRENSAKYMLWFRLLFSQTTSLHFKSAQKWLMALVAWWRLGLDKQACLCVSRPSPTTTLIFSQPNHRYKIPVFGDTRTFPKMLKPMSFHENGDWIQLWDICNRSSRCLLSRYTPPYTTISIMCLKTSVVKIKILCCNAWIPSFD